VNTKPCRGWLILIGSIMSFAGCANKPPGWVSEIPGSMKELCAIGISGPTLYPEDARARSKASAMTELARALELTVKLQLTMKMSGNSRGRIGRCRRRPASPVMWS